MKLMCEILVHRYSVKPTIKYPVAQLMPGTSMSNILKFVHIFTQLDSRLVCRALYEVSE